MKFRDHPLMIRKSGYISWPPLWTTPHSDKDDKPVGEIGILEDVAVSNLINNKIFLFMRYRSYRYMGVLAFDDPAFCRVIFTILKNNVDRSIEEIGDLDLGHTL